VSDAAKIPDTARLTGREDGKLYQTRFICSHLWLGTSDKWIGFSQVDSEAYDYVCLDCFRAEVDDAEKRFFHCVQEIIATRRVTPFYPAELPSSVFDQAIRIMSLRYFAHIAERGPVKYGQFSFSMGVM
jgi:hypothetical protein